MRLLRDFIRLEKEYKALLSTRKALLSSKQKPVCVSGLCEGAKYAFYASLIKDEGDVSLVILPDEKDCIKMSLALEAYSVNCVVYTARDFMFRNIVSSHEYEHQRLSILADIINNNVDCVITTGEGALQLTMPKEVLRSKMLHFENGGICELDDLSNRLSRMGYTRVDTVDGVGQFAIRGGICDIFTPGNAFPYRMELFGDDIDSMGTFDVMTQRRIESVDSFNIFPVREVIADPDSLSALSYTIDNQLKKAKDSDVKKRLLAELDAIESSQELLFIDKYISVVYDTPEALIDYFTSSSLILLDSPAKIRERIIASETINNDIINTMLSVGEIDGKYANYSIPEADYDYIISNSAAIVTDSFENSQFKYAELFSFRTKTTFSVTGAFDILANEINEHIKNNFAVVLLCENEATAQNFSRHFSELDLEIPVIAPNEGITDEIYGCAVLSYECAAPGFILDTSKLLCLSLYANQSTYSKKSGIRRGKKKKHENAGEKIMSYADLSEGDYVVHDTHGIGIYLGAKSITDYEGITRDFLCIEYADKATLYVPCERLDVLSKYIGAGSSEGTVRLNKMGGAEWSKAKSHVKAEVKEMARELIDLYARRLKLPGYSFSRDDDMQRQFEASFEYEETECQLSACNDIKRDMQAPHPMDRLLCGDVGYGKTEVALRAAFKAVSDNKQVAILVPTTILTMQHYQTVLARMRTFPVNVGILSRFRTPKQQTETLKKLKRGDIDIIIGTHRMISKDVEFKDLGLIIIDEEQRFGVAHKEKLKQLAPGADVLTLTATPIPRTLNMAISGIRDMSILDEPPQDRLPPQTYVVEYEEALIAEVIRKELRRGGQVFYLHNNIDDIDRCAYRISQLVPDAVIGIAHGGMDKDDLSDVWESVVNGETDILVCTTIIETGVDVPNANTLIIENADRMGLSQLHQIRGRIGRSTRRSYAYFTYQKYKTLSSIQEKRLMTLREYTEFGAGFKIALRDLEIRGAGNVLGAKQHGHMESVGYDMYIKLLNSAVLEEKGESPIQKPDCAVELTFSAYIPESYIKTSAQRIEIYKKISHIQNAEDADDIADELLDRFGDIPQSVCSLIDISYIRALGQKLGIKRIEQKQKTVTFYAEGADLKSLVSISSESGGRMFITPGPSPHATYRIKNGDNVLGIIRNTLEKALRV